MQQHAATSIARHTAQREAATSFCKRRTFSQQHTHLQSFSNLQIKFTDRSARMLQAGDHRDRTHTRFVDVDDVRVSRAACAQDFLQLKKNVSSL